MTALAKVQAVGNTGTTATSLACTVAKPATGDIMVCFLAVQGQASHITGVTLADNGSNTGWTISTSLQASSANDFVCAYRLATSTDHSSMTTVTWSWTNAGTHSSMEFDEFNTAAAFIGSATIDTGTPTFATVTSTALNFNSVGTSPVYVNELWVIAGEQAGTNGGGVTWLSSNTSVLPTAVTTSPTGTPNTSYLNCAWAASLTTGSPSTKESWTTDRASAMWALGFYDPSANVAGTASQTTTYTGAAAGIVAYPGTGAETSTYTGAAASAVAVPSTAAQTSTFSGLAAGGIQGVGAASETVTFTGIAVGVATVTGTGAQTSTFTGAAVGAVGLAGTASQTTTFTGAAAALDYENATASQTSTLSNSAAGVVGIAAAATETATYTGSAAGTIVATGEQDTTFTDTAVGHVGVAGTAEQDTIFTSTAVSAIAATAAQSTTVTCSATGVVGVAGTAAQTSTYTAEADGISTSGRFGTGAQSTSVGSLAVGAATIPATAAQTPTVTTAAVGLATVSGTSSQTSTVTAGAVGSVIFAGSGTQSATYTGVASGLSNAATGTITKTISVTALAAGVLQVPIAGTDYMPTFIPPIVVDEPPYLPDSTPTQVNLFRYMPSRARGINVFKRSDGTFCVDTPVTSELQMTQPAVSISRGLSGIYEPGPASPDFPALTDTNIPYPWNPYYPDAPYVIGNDPYANPSAISETLEPYIVDYWMGGHIYTITQETALELTAVGFGDCIA